MTLAAKPEVMFLLHRRSLNSGGYDNYGVYYGIGQPLWECESVDEVDGEIIGFEFRADNRDHAKDKVRAKYTKLDVRFYQ